MLGRSAGAWIWNQVNLGEFVSSEYEEDAVNTYGSLQMNQYHWRLTLLEGDKSPYSSLVPLWELKHSVSSSSSQ